MSSSVTHRATLAGYGAGRPRTMCRKPALIAVADRVPGEAGLVVGDRQVDRADDRGGVAADLGAVAVQQRAAADDVVDVAAGDVPQVGVLGGHPQHGGRASADKDRRVRALDGLGVAERPGEADVGCPGSRTVRARSTTAGSPCTPRRGSPRRRRRRGTAGRARHTRAGPSGGWAVSRRRCRSRAGRRRRCRRSWRSWPASRAGGSGCWSRAGPGAAAGSGRRGPRAVSSLRESVRPGRRRSA